MKKIVQVWIITVSIVFLAFSAGYTDSLLDKILPQRDAQQKTLPLRGNIDSKVYHAPDCEYYMCKNCTQTFATAQEAEKAGYHPCSLCQGKEGNYKGKRQAKTILLHGNPNSKIVHGPSCKYYTAPTSSETFSSYDQAVKKGYRLCSLCNGK